MMAATDNFFDKYDVLQFLFNSSIEEFEQKLKDGFEIKDNHMVALFARFEQNNHDKVRLAIQYGGNVNASYNKDFSLIHFAIYHQTMKKLYVLLEHGVDIYKKDRDGITVLDYARQRQKMLSLSAECDFKDNPPLDKKKRCLCTRCYGNRKDIKIVTVLENEDKKRTTLFMSLLPLVDDFLSNKKQRIN